MEDIRSYRLDDEAQQQRRREDDINERREFEAASEDEVPFHIPRD